MPLDHRGSADHVGFPPTFDDKPQPSHVVTKVYSSGQPGDTLVLLIAADQGHPWKVSIHPLVFDYDTPYGCEALHTPFCFVQPWRAQGQVIHCFLPPKLAETLMSRQRTSNHLADTKSAKHLDCHPGSNQGYST
jgi:hypothetical protein